MDNKEKNNSEKNDDSIAPDEVRAKLERSQKISGISMNKELEESVAADLKRKDNEFQKSTPEDYLD